MRLDTLPELRHQSDCRSNFNVRLRVDAYHLNSAMIAFDVCVHRVARAYDPELDTAVGKLRLLDDR